MNKTSVSKKILSVCLSVLMVLSVCVVGFSPLAQYANAEINVEEDTGNPVFSLKWNVPESIYLKPGSGDFEYFLTNKLSASGSAANSTAAESCDVSAVAPMADSITLSYELEANGKKPDGTEVSAAGLSLSIANNVAGAQSLNNTLTGCALSGYTDAIAGNEYFIKWTLKFKVTTNGTQEEYTEYAYTSIYVPSLQTAGSSIFFKASPIIGFKPRNSVYNFLTGGHTVSGGNGYASRFTSSNVAGLEANKTLTKDQLDSATYVAPLVLFTGGNSYNGDSSDDIDYMPTNSFRAGATVPAGNRLFDKYTVESKADGGVYADSESKNNGQWFQVSDMSAAEAPKLNITIDASRFSDYSQVPNLYAGWMQYGAYGIESGNRLRWIAGVNTGSSYNGSTAKGMLTGDDAKEDTIQAGKVAVSCNADTTDERSNYVSLARGLSGLAGTVKTGHNVMMYAYKTVYDGVGSSTSTNAVIAGVDLNVTATNKQALRTKTCEAYVNGSGIKTGANDDAITAYINAVAAADKILADQFATQTEIDNALTVLNNKASNDVKTTIAGYYHDDSTPVLDIVAFNVPETIYLNPTYNASSSYGYVYDQTLSVTPDKNTQGQLTGTHTATVAVNKPTQQAGDTENKLPAVTKNISSGGIIEFFCATADPNSVKLYCSDANAVFGTKEADGGVKLTKTGDGMYKASVTSGTHAYESGYITWYVQFTDTVDGMQKTATAKTYIYAPYLAPVGAASYVRDETAGHKNVHLAEISWWSGVHSRGDKPSWNGIGTEDGGSFEGYANTKDDNASYYLSPLVDGIGATTGNVDSSNWLNTSGSSGLPLTMRYNTFYKYNGGNKWVTAATTGYKALLNVDTSRITNLKDVLYLTVGTMLTQAENTSGNQNYYLAETTNYYNGGKNDDDQKHNTYSTSGDAVIASGTYNTDTDTNGGSIYNSFYTKDLSNIAGNKVTFAYEAGFEGKRDDGWRYKIAYPCVTTYCPIEVTLSNKQAVRNSIIAAQELFTKLGIYYDGTNYTSLYYNPSAAAFTDFISDYEDAQKALTKVDGADGGEASALDNSTEALEDAVNAATSKEATPAQKAAILKGCESKQYNVSYDASGDKILRKLNNAEGKDVTFTESYYAKDDISYTAESYEGYDFLGFIKASSDLNYNGITGSQVMSGTPDYIESAVDYQNQAVTLSGFGTTSAVAYPNTVPAVSNGSLTYTDTVDSGIYMIGVYQPHHYTVTYKANGGTGADKTDSNAYGADYNLAGNTAFTKTNYLLTSWNTVEDGSGDSYAPGLKLPVADMPTEEGGAITLYAQWTPDPTKAANYTINVYTQKATLDGYELVNTVTGEGTVGEVISIKAIAGFTLAEGSLNNTLAAGENTFTVKFDRNAYKAYFKSNDGSSTYASYDVLTGVQPAYSGTPPTKSGFENVGDMTAVNPHYEAGHYSFKGWADEPGSSEIVTEYEAIVDKDVTYYAVFDVVAHSFATVVETGATCLAGGYTTYTCSCGYSYNTAPGDAAGHDFENGTVTDEEAPTCIMDGFKIMKCRNCDATTTVTVKSQGTEHSYVETPAVAATCEETGNIQYFTCSVCGKKFSAQNAASELAADAKLTTDALGHNYGAPAFTWTATETGYTCVATRTCANDASHKDSKDCVVTVKNNAPTCDTAGSKVYTATVTFDKDHSENKTLPGDPAAGHSWGDPVFSWSDDHSECSAIFTCTNDASHTKTVPCSVESHTTDPTGGNDGYTEYVATVTEDGKTYTSETETVTEEGSAKGYDVTVNFEFADHSKAAEPVSIHYEPTATDYSIDAAAVAGYTPDRTVVSGTFQKTDTALTFTVTYTANTDTAYTVKHFKQNADGDGYTEAEADRQNLTGTTATMTAVTAKTYTGFTAQTVDQQIIRADGSTVVNVYYNRDVYTVTWTVDDGAEVTGETASVLYGNDISFSVEYDEGHDQVLPAVTATGGVIAETATNAYTVSNITGNVEIKVPTALNKYAVSVKGDNGVTVSAGADVDHNGTYVLTVTAKEDYTKKAPTATANGETVALVKGEGNTYTAEIANIKANTSVIVTSYIDTHTLTVNYQYEDSTKAADSVTGEYAVGADYSAASPVITGFTPVTVTAAGNSDAKTVAGKMGSSDITVTVVYKTDNNNNGTADEDETKITVKYEIGRYGTAVIGQNYEVKVTPGTEYKDVIKPVVSAKTGFTFVKWNDEALTVVDEATATDGVITVTATYSTKDENGDDIILDADAYLVKFYNYDGKLLKAEAVDAGEKATAPAETPERGDFTFAGWTPEFDADAAVYADASYTATFKTAKTEGGEEYEIGSDEFVVSFYTFNGKLIEAQFVKSGDTAAAPELPVRNGFTPAGWTPAFSAAAAVTEDASYTATYKTVLTPGAEEEIVPAGKYVVKFFTFDGKLLETKTVDGGAEIEAASVPARTGFTSAGWTPEFKAVVTEDASYTATYKTVLTPGAEEEIVPAGKYVVKFFNFDGALIEAQLISAGGHATTPADTPERGDFTFAGWTPEFDADKAVNADASYTATFKTAKTEGGAEEVIGSDEFVVSFVDHDGALIEAQFVKSGEKATAPATDPVRTGCDFAGWTPEFNADAAVTADKTYTASYTTVLTEGGEDVEVPANAFVVRFMNYDGSLIKAEIVSAGEKASAPAETPVRGDFTFAGWTPAFNANAAVNADATYTATFKTAKTEGGEEVLIPDGQFVIRFYTFDGKLYKTDFVKAGDPVSAPATAPARGSFTFAGWTPAIETPAAEDASYTATYKTALTEGGEEVLIPDGQFVVRFLDHKGKLIAAQFVAKGGTAVAPDMTTEISHYDENGHYGFSKWDKTFDNITADTAVNAEYGFTAHVFAEKDIIDPDCIHNGSKTEFCVCGYEKTGVVIDKLGHDIVVDDAVAPSCTESGLTAGKHCARCETVLEAQRKVAALGHSFGAWSIRSYATATEDGVMVRVCSRCGAEETKTYAKSDEYLEIRGSGVLPAGQTVVIEVVRMPINVVEENVTWTSSDPSVATVDEDGSIMVIGMGQVTLTAAAADGLTVTKTFHVSDDGNTRVIKFQNMDKMYYIVGGYHYIYNNGYIRWSKDYGVNIRVHLYQTFNFSDVIIRANGVELKQNADGTYTVPASDSAVIITAEGAGVDADTGEKISFWQMLINFFRKIVDFFKNLFK